MRALRTSARTRWSSDMPIERRMAGISDRAESVRVGMGMTRRELVCASRFLYSFFVSAKKTHVCFLQKT